LTNSDTALSDNRYHRNSDISVNVNRTVLHRVPEKEAALTFAVISPSVEIFLQFVKHFVQE